MIYQHKESDLKYAHVWRKYKRVLLKMMVDAKKGEQKYELSAHEFMDVTPARISGYAFELKLSNGRPSGNLSKSLLVADLLYVLQHSPKAIELSVEAVYSFQMSKEFKLTVSCETSEN